MSRIDENQVASPKKEKISDEKKESNKNNKKDNGHINSPMRTMAIRQITSFKHPFILVEDFHHQNLLPFSKEFYEGDVTNTGPTESLPQLHYHHSTVSPFCPSPELLKKTEDIEDNLEIGFCKGCNRQFTDLHAHVESIVKENDSPFKTIDNIFQNLKKNK